MTAYNVEAIMPPIEDDNWDELRDLIDVIPGTILIEDPYEPTLIFPVEAESESDAISLLNGIFMLRDTAPIKGRICEDTDDDCPEPDDGAKASWALLAS